MSQFDKIHRPFSPGENQAIKLVADLGELNNSFGVQLSGDDLVELEAMATRVDRYLTGLKEQLDKVKDEKSAPENP